MERAIDNGEYVSELFMDLSKAFGTINHDLMIAKLRAYGFSKEALNFIRSYLKNRKQRDVIAGVSQSSIDGPLLFNTFINDLLFFNEQSTLINYADNNNTM